MDSKTPDVPEGSQRGEKGARRRILIVEDLARWLEYDYEVVTAADGLD